MHVNREYGLFPAPWLVMLYGQKERFHHRVNALSMESFLRMIAEQEVRKKMKHERGTLSLVEDRMDCLHPSKGTTEWLLRAEPQAA